MPSWKDLRRFLDKNARLFRRASKHDIYLWKGETIICSRSSSEIGSHQWQKILKQELKITQEEFNKGL